MAGTTTNGSAPATEDQADIRQRFRQLMQNSLITGPRSGNPVLNEVAKHFGADPADLPMMADMYPFHLFINRQTGLDAFLAAPGRKSTVKGIVVATTHFWGKLPDLLLPPSLPIPAPRFGQLQDQRVEAGYQKWLRCLTRGLIFVRDAEGPALLWVNGGYFEVMAPTIERTIAILNEIREYGVKHSPYRGQCVDIFVWKGILRPRFVERPTGITADDVVLPPGLLDRIEEHVVGISRHAEKLLRAKRHLKRGLLLWGRPGTGKTHTIRYLASQLPEHTVLTLPGSHLDNLSHLSDLIPVCTPGIVVLDDVDYIAEDRSMPSMGAAQSLYELLETLDGMSPDSELLFVLTTNRADTIEPAVAARPGRIDQALEVPPPDVECRRRLFDLYSKGVRLEMDETELADIIQRTQGVTGSFFKELLRRATLRATDEGHDSGAKVVVTGHHVNEALDEMLDPTNPLTTKILGGETDEHGPLGADMAASG